jgi:hypothetical protein
MRDFSTALRSARNDKVRARGVYPSIESTMMFVMSSEVETSLDVSAAEIIGDSSTSLDMTEG